MVKVWVLSYKGEKELMTFWLIDMSLNLIQRINFMDVIAMGILFKKSYKKTTTKI